MKNLKHLPESDPLWENGLPGDEEFANIDHDLALEIPEEDTVIYSGPHHEEAFYDLVEQFEL